MGSMGKVLDLTKIFKGKNGGWVLTILGLCGILLIFMSSMFSGTKTKTQVSSAPTMAEYSAGLEEKLEKIITRITGSSEVDVLVTLESGYEYIYADEIIENKDKTEEIKGENSKKVQEKGSTEQKYIMVEGADGRDIALLLTELSPRVKGVVIVCEGGSDDYIRENIVSAVMAALDIPSRRIFVTG